MSKIKDGGSAFPGIRIVERDNYHPNIKVYYKGMTLRDWFAGQALNKLARPTFPIHDECKGLPKGGNARECIAWDAKVCYAYADAMLAEREKQPQEC